MFVTNEMSTRRSMTSAAENIKKSADSSSSSSLSTEMQTVNGKGKCQCDKEGDWSEMRVNKTLFDAVYYGSITLDRRYTPSMLPWLVAEVKRRGQKGRSVKLEVRRHSGQLICQCAQTNTIWLDHRLAHMYRLIQTMHNKKCFAYLIKNAQDSQSQNCYVFQAADENMVQDFFSSVKEASRDSSGQHSPIQSHLSSVSSTSSSSSDSGTQRYELLYVGKIKVSHRKPPSTFIDEAVDRFKALEYEKFKHFQELGIVAGNSGSSERQRHGSGTSIASLPPNLEHFVSIRENELDSQVGRLGGSTSSNEDSSSMEKIPARGHRRACSVESDLVVRKGSDPDLNGVSGTAANNNNNVSEAKTLFRNAENSHPLQWTNDSSPVSSSSDINATSRVRSCSFGNDVQGRGRSNSIASGQNRTMVFQIGKTEISLISLDKKSIILSKPFRDISHCSQGMRHPDHFGFICRDAGSETYLGYILKCQAENVTEEILTTLKQVFASAAALQRTLRNQFLMCETCPMLWLHKLCMDLEGLQASKANTIITRRLDTLSSEEKHEILMKLKGAEVTSSQEQNEILMMLLRAHCETKQSKHTHTDSQGGKLEHLNVGFFDKKHQSVLDDLKNKAKRSLTSSFENILKRKPADDARKAFRERSNTLDADSSSYRDSSNGASSDHSPSSTPDRKESSFDFLEGINENNPFRRRSSTIGVTRDRNVEAQTPRREFPQHPRSKLIRQKTSPMMNIFMKVGNPSKPTTPDDEMVTPNKTGSWRQAIFNRVVTPHRKPPDCSNKSLDGLSLPACVPAGPPVKRSPATLRSLWRKAIKQQILLIRMEKENKKLKANQDAVQVKRVKLDYEEITPCLKEITKVWDEMLKKEKLEKFGFQTLVDAVKAGVPRPRRGEIWQLLAEQNDASEEDGSSEAPSEDLSSCYEDLLKQLTAQQHAILIDLGRTFPNHPYFSVSLGAGQLSLFNLLKAYSLLDKEVGYCQGLSFIAGVLLLHMEEDNSFEMLKHILYTLGFRRQFKPDMIALQIQMYQLSRLIHDQHPDLYNHFERHEIAPTLYAAPWFLTLFASQFPLGFVARVFDLIFLYGLEVVFKVALVLLGNHKELIIQCNTFESVMDFLKCTMPGMGIIQMERVFNQVFNLNISKQLQAYEVEYHVLQEESLSGPPPGVDPETVAQLELANRNLKRHNADLMEELQAVHNNARTLERTISSYQACTSKQESRLKTLELEKSQLKQLVETLKKNWPQTHFETCSDILSNYELDLLRSESRSPRPYRLPASDFSFNRTINRHSSRSPAYLEEGDGDDEDVYLTNGYERGSHPSKMRSSANGSKAN